MTLRQFMNELKHSSIQISLIVDDYQQEPVYNNTLGSLNHWVHLPKYINYVIIDIRPMMMLKGFHVLIGSDEEC